MIKVPDKYYITRDTADFSHVEQARLMFEKGIEWVQLRMKNSCPGEIEEQAHLAKKYADLYGGKLIINDSPEIAMKVGAHGLHLGLNDLPVDQARFLVGPNTIIGGTANKLEEVLRQVERGADYIGVGPFRFTTTKQNLSPVLGVEGYRTLVNELKSRKIDTPIVAVGGITNEDIPVLLRAGVSGVALSGALFSQMIGNKV